MENGILVEVKQQDLGLEPQAVVQEEVQKFIPSNITEFFFYDDQGECQFSDIKTRECYSEFVNTLTFIFNNLKANYGRFTSKVLTYEDLQAIDFPPYPQDLEVKGLEYYLYPDLRVQIKELQRQMKEEAAKQENDNGIAMSGYVEKVSINEEQSTQLQEEEAKFSDDIVSHLSDPDDQSSPNGGQYNLDSINEEEEIKLPADTIPIIMTNVKEGRRSKLNDNI